MAVAMKLGEPLVEAMVEKLKLGMPARISQINAELTDMVMAAPADGSYFTGRVLDFPLTPAVFVMEGPARFAPEGAHGLRTEFDILVYVGESDQNGQLLARRLQRQVRAVIETLWDDEPREALAGSAYNLHPIRTTPGTVFEPSSTDTSWRAFYVVVFRAEQLET